MMGFLTFHAQAAPNPQAFQGTHLWGALAVLHGLVCATGNAQDGVVLAAFALTLHAV